MINGVLPFHSIMLFDDNDQGLFDRRIIFKDGVLYANIMILSLTMKFFDQFNDFDDDDIDLTTIDYPPEISRESFRYCLAFAYSTTQLSDVQIIRNGPHPSLKSVDTTLDYFNASTSLTESTMRYTIPAPTYDHLIEHNMIDRIKELSYLVEPPYKDLIHSAAVYGQMEMMEYLLRNICVREDIHEYMFYTNTDGNNALMLACLHGHHKIAAMLIKHMDQQSISDDQQSNSDDIYDDIYEDISISDNYRFSNGIIGVPNSNGDSAISLACINGYEEVIEVLLNHLKLHQNYFIYGAKNDNNCTPLMIACSKGHANIVDLFVRRDRLQDEELMRTDIGKGPNEFIMAIENNHIDVVRMLLDRYTPEYVMQMFVGINDNSALMIASEYGYDRIVSLIADMTTNDYMMATNRHGCTALMLACRWGHIDVVEECLTYLSNDDVMYTSEDGNNALIEASRNGYSEIVKVLLQYVTNSHVLNMSCGKYCATPEIVDLLEDKVKNERNVN